MYTLLLGPGPFLKGSCCLWKIRFTHTHTKKKKHRKKKQCFLSNSAIVTVGWGRLYKKWPFDRLYVDLQNKESSWVANWITSCFFFNDFVGGAPPPPAKWTYPSMKRDLISGRYVLASVEKGVNTSPKRGLSQDRQEFQVQQKSPHT